MKPTTLATAAMYMGAGAAHFARPDFFEAIVPEWFPDKKLANQASGAAEIVLGAGMLLPQTRKAAGWGLLGLTAAVFPANIDMAINKVDVRPDEDGTYQRYVGEVPDARNWIRLPFQAVFVALIWKGAGLRWGR
ncbi:MAG: hypothetical protein HKN26_03075 [Acidimicrobiales bacterium]|nr:hypothetical protein [Acidimicrobiales bacterium]